MQRVSFKTLVLMLLLLGSVVAHQQIRCESCTCASTVWLADDGTDPNEVGDPGPENCFRSAPPVWLEEVPPADANEPEESIEPIPESIGWMPTLPTLDVDPNDPGDPGPEYV